MQRSRRVGGPSRGLFLDLIGLSQLLRRSDSIRSVLMEAGERLVSAMHPRGNVLPFLGVCGRPRRRGRILEWRTANSGAFG